MGIVLKLERIPVNIGLGVCLGMVPLVAYNYAAGNRARMRRFVDLARIAILAFSCACVALFWIFARPIVGAFIEDEETVRLGARFLRGRCFADEHARVCAWLAGSAKIRKAPEAANALYVQKAYYPVYDTRDRFSSLGLFHSMFLLQWLTDLPREKIRYLELTIRKTEGIGSILSTYSKVSQAFEKLGIAVYLSPGCTRYSDDMLARYFALGGTPKDATPSNTAFAKCFNASVLNYFVQRNPVMMDLSVLQPAFVEQMREYADQVLGEKKALGVLLRGTDYVIANFAGSYRPADIDDCVRAIRERMERYGYDRIFLATEDQSYLERMLMEFPRRVIAVSQERHSVSDFKTVKYISDLEKSERSGRDYEAMVEDTTVNYLYAMYMLSRCESLLANCMCSGVNFATSFNGGKYVRNEIVNEGRDRD